MYRDLPERHPIRLRGYDYGKPGRNFITIVTYGRAEILGDVVDGNVRLTAAGMCVDEVWKSLPRHYRHYRHYRHIVLDAFIVMPNHIHGIVQLTPAEIGGSKASPLSEIVSGFKTFSARRVNLLRGVSGTPVWQRNYCERIIRDPRELQHVRAYIAANPAAWANDPKHPSLHP